MTRHPILSKLDVSRAKLLASIDGLADTALDARPADGGWSIRQNLTHLAASEADHCRVIEVIAAGQPDRLPEAIDRDAHNAARLDELGSLRLAQILEALADQRARTEALFAQLTPEQLEIVGLHPVLGEMAVSAIFRMLAIHEQMHIREIAAIRARLSEI
jgi:hypothetical protein